MPKRLIFTIPDEMHTAFLAACAKEDRPAARVLRRLVEDYLKQQEKTAKRKEKDQ